MSTRKTNVPAIPAIENTPDSVNKALHAVKEAVEVGLGRRGDSLDRFVTVRELGDSGIASVVTKGGKAGIAAVAAPAAPGSGGNGPPGSPVFNPGDPNFGTADFTKPPAPSNVQANPVSQTAIMVTWNPPNFSNYKDTEVFVVAGTTPGQVSAVFDITDGGKFNPNKPVGVGNTHSAFVGYSFGTIFTHSNLANIVPTGSDPLSAALNPVPRFYFVRFVSTANVPGPYAPLTGAAGKVMLDPQAVLAALINNVSNSSIYKSLVGTYIDPQMFANITSAGGVLPYLAAQQNVLKGNINQQLVNIIGTSDNPPGPNQLPTLYSSISTLSANTASNSASLSQINKWQTALSTGTGGTAATSATLTITSQSIVGTQSFWYCTPVPSSQVSAGDTLTISANGNAQFSALNGKRVTVNSPAISGGNVIGVWTPNTTTDGTSLPSTGNANLSPQPTLTASAGNSFVDFMSGIYQSIWSKVDGKSAIGAQLLATQANVGTLQNTVTQNTSALTKLSGEMSSLWSVQMQQIGDSGIFASAGFGLSLDTTTNPTGGFTQTSTFIVNANQFCVMGPSAHAGAIITAISSSGSNATLTLSTANHGFIAAQDASGNWTKQAGFMIPAPPYNTSGPNQNPLAGLGLENVVADVIATNTNTVTIKRNDGGSFPTFSNIGTLGNALVPSASKVFFVDSVNSVVGINGDLIVKGMVAATSAQVGTLKATTAFIQQITSEQLNSNLIVGQRIIAGAPGNGIYTGATSSISNFIVELNNPSSPNGAYPLNYYNPSTGQQAFFVDKSGNVGLAGNISVGRNATIATTGQNVFSVGGVGDNGMYPNVQYALWLGPQSAFGNNGIGRTEGNALLWVRDDQARAGVNAGFFLGDVPIVAPTADGYVNVPATRSGGPATVFVSANICLVPNSDGSSTSVHTDLGAILLLVSSNFSSTIGAGTVRSGVGISNQAAINDHVIVDNSTQSDGPPNLPAGTQVAFTQVDCKGSDIKNVNLQGAVTVPAGAYKALMYVWRKPPDSCGPEACFSANFFATIVR